MVRWRKFYLFQF